MKRKQRKAKNDSNVPGMPSGNEAWEETLRVLLQKHHFHPHLAEIVFEYSGTSSLIQWQQSKKRYKCVTLAGLPAGDSYLKLHTMFVVKRHKQLAWPPAGIAMRIGDEEGKEEEELYCLAQNTPSQFAQTLFTGEVVSLFLFPSNSRNVLRDISDTFNAAKPFLADKENEIREYMVLRMRDADGKLMKHLASCFIYGRDSSSETALISWIHPPKSVSSICRISWRCLINEATLGRHYALVGFEVKPSGRHCYGREVGLLRCSVTGTRKPCPQKCLGRRNKGKSQSGCALHCGVYDPEKWWVNDKEKKMKITRKSKTAKRKRKRNSYKY